ncbi:MAG: CGNR zinc finger domain-containing protein [Candidatus Zixiibacteriota bacterium]|nr:MAG: CGNR zinc finger domain-containing protein [candidate division Zixibacteria bacterium]
MSIKDQGRSIDSLRLYGGVLCLDFVNTVHSRVEAVTFDYIKDYGDLLRWLRRCEAAPDQVMSMLKEWYATDRQGSDTALNEIKEIRDLLYRITSALAAGGSPEKTDLNRFQNLVEKTWAYLSIEPGRRSWKWAWSSQKIDLGHPVRLVIKSAAELLLSDHVVRIKECPACGWVFLDRSKNSSRRWCSMETCGSIDKASRYYYRRKGNA